MELRWRSFELDAAAPKVSPQSSAESMARKYGISLEEAKERERRLVDLAAAEGLTISSNRLRANTHDAHRLLHFAAAHGKQSELSRRLFVAYFAEGKVISDHNVLVQLAAEAGLDAGAARVALQSGAHAAAVATDIRAARAFGANGVPFWLFDRRLAISGCQPAEVFLKALERAWAERQ